MSEVVYVLDSEGLSQAVLGHRVTGARLKEADRSGIRVVTTSMTLIEGYHGRVKKAAWAWALSKIAVEPVTKEIAGEAIELRRQLDCVDTSAPPMLLLPPWRCVSVATSRSSRPMRRT
ncbi:hypothetical protein KCMC57_up36540 [Kitasatospora sp. CMC57]|uniref:PIN domain-containing protein n=1 Tax=Kitasatospora sp. CMC57 TaxID=3231513 RepID=A0AB33JW08_9ACTN